MDNEQDRKKIKNYVPFRMNVLFLIVFVLFSILILRLGMVQIVEGEKFVRYAEATEDVVAKTNTPRGKIKDEKGNLIVDNNPIFNLVYTRKRDVSVQEMLEIAEKLAHYIEMDDSKVTERDLKDYYIISKGIQELSKDKLNEEEIAELEEDEIYELLLERVTAAELSEIDDAQREVVAIWREMNSGYALSEQVIKEDVSKREFAVINEHLSELDGVDIQPDGERIFPYDDTLSAVIGDIGQIPREKKDYYAAKGYDLNDEVGTSGLEEQYEEVLSGIKEKKKYVTDRSGNTVEEPVIIPGKRGKDLTLTIDMRFQLAIEEILEEEIAKNRRYNVDSAYAVVLDPKTGAVRALAGKRYEGGEFKDDPSGTYLKAFAAGSAVKGATVITGMANGVMQPGEYIRDRKLTIGQQTKGSYQDLGSVNDLTALERSSNVYMFYIGMRLAGYGYECNCWTGDKSGEAAFREGIEKYREMFHQFGLGVPTGIDLPYEATGYKGSALQIGLVMDFGIGQYDTYTPLQLAQYVSTIANGGYRMKPQIVKEIRDPGVGDEPGKLVKRFEPQLMNRVNADPYYFERVQQGFYRVTHGSRGTARGVPGAAKTGTAEVGRKGSGLNNSLLVGYAPYDDPEMAYAVVVPEVRGGTTNQAIGTRIVETYMEMKDEPYVLNTSETTIPVASEQE